MLTNFHTHTCFCDGKNTPEEVVQAAIEKGFSAIGFSAHAYTPFDLSYCIRDEDGYRREIHRLQDRYRDRIAIFLGLEEDAFSPIDRSRVDYIIGSSHYLHIGTADLPIDSGYEGFQACLDGFGGDALQMSEAYYRNFCDYIKVRKPDIVGHFDLITKYEEAYDSCLFSNPHYEALAGRFLTEAAQSGCLFEVNTGAIARGLRSAPYPSEPLLHILKQQGCGIILSSDCHNADYLDCAFAETKQLLREIGFTSRYTLTADGFVEIPL